MTVGDEVLGQGQGRTKKEAERTAAEAALAFLEDGHAEAETGRSPSWPIYSAVLAEALTVALSLAPQDASVSDVRREAAQLYRDLLGELGHQPEV